jgi:hypothetical protein
VRNCILGFNLTTSRLNRTNLALLDLSRILLAVIKALKAA